METLLAISVKGVLEFNGRYLLRQNERDEQELLGGKLEPDERIEQRLVQEFREESGVRVEVQHHLEPWLYTIGNRNVIILPYKCRALRVPDVLFDEDHGHTQWFDASQIDSLNMPAGYFDSIHGRVPTRSRSIIPNPKPRGVEAFGYEASVALLIEREGGDVLSKEDGSLPAVELTGESNPRAAAEELRSRMLISDAGRLTSLRPLARERSLVLTYYTFATEDYNPPDGGFAWRSRTELDVSLDDLYV